MCFGYIGMVVHVAIPSVERLRDHNSRRIAKVGFRLDPLTGQAESHLCAFWLSCSPQRVPISEEVAGAGEVHGHAGLLGRFDDLLIADGAARLHDGLDARVDKHLAPSANGKNASDAATAPVARSAPSASVLARSTAKWQESTRLTWPMPMPTVAWSWASRMALDFTQRIARHANTRSFSVSASAASPATSSRRPDRRRRR